ASGDGRSGDGCPIAEPASFLTAMRSFVRSGLVLPLGSALAAAFACAANAVAADAAYPSKPVRIVVPYTPGGGIDFIGRILAQELGKALGQQVLVENRPGGSTTVGADAVAKAAPDGYTLLVTSHSIHAFLPNTARTLPFDADKDFAPVSL